ncbi:hypothetical protein DQG23_37835 [Paenibacillus contaminans]|uniref:Uncharacterized protein n=1 Tax=Paenibacillus contaminans TaxID=450362 RepID=A0A329LRT7_9BACL|nr:hypothetical protein DQG23_37835 [Paenibacillus contaminans]
MRQQRSVRAGYGRQRIRQALRVLHVEGQLAWQLEAAGAEIFRNDVRVQIPASVRKCLVPVQQLEGDDGVVRLRCVHILQVNDDLPFLRMIDGNGRHRKHTQIAHVRSFAEIPRENIDLQLIRCDIFRNGRRIFVLGGASPRNARLRPLGKLRGIAVAVRIDETHAVPVIIECRLRTVDQLDAEPHGLIVGSGE